MCFFGLGGRKLFLQEKRPPNVWFGGLFLFKAFFLKTFRFLL